MTKSDESVMTVEQARKISAPLYAALNRPANWATALEQLLVALPQPYEEALTTYENLVPPMDPAAFAQAGSWNEVLEIAALTAPHGFMRYYCSDIGTAMAGSPSKRRATQYLMGNHTIAERMFRHDPAVMLHAPLRTLVFVGSGLASAPSRISREGR